MTNLALGSITASGGTTTARPEDRFGDVLNVRRDFGAKADGSDDGPELQAALNAIRTTAPGKHRSLYFPAGRYFTSQVLYITNTEGAHIFGDGPAGTTIEYQGSPAAGNSEAPSDGGANAMTPVIMTNGFSYSKLEGLGLVNQAGANTVGMYFFQDATHSKGTVTGLYINDILVSGNAGSIATSFLIGYQASALCSEIMFSNCNVSGATQYGFRNVSTNSLNNNLYNCGGVNCNVWASVPIGTMNIHGASLSGNGIDIEVGGGNAVSITGCRTESFNFCDVGTAGQANVSIAGCVYNPADLTTPGYFLQANNGAAVDVSGCAITKHPSVAATIKQGVFKGSNSFITINSCRIDDHRPFADLTNVQLILAGNTFIRDPEPINTCTGRILDLRGLYTTVATLPTAGTHLKGVRGHVTDATVTASTSNFSSTVTGGGANTVPVWCDGTNWRIG